MTDEITNDSAGARGIKMTKEELIKLVESHLTRISESMKIPYEMLKEEFVEALTEDGQ